MDNTLTFDIPFLPMYTYLMSLAFYLRKRYTVRIYDELHAI